MTYVARPIAPDGRELTPPSPERRYGRTLRLLYAVLTPGTPYMVYREAGGWLDVIAPDGSTVDHLAHLADRRTYPVHYSPKVPA